MDEIFVGKLVNTRGLKGEVKAISNFEMMFLLKVDTFILMVDLML